MIDDQRIFLLVTYFYYSLTAAVYANEFCAYNVTSMRSNELIHVSWSKLNDACKEPFYVRVRLTEMSHKDFRIPRNGPNFLDVNVSAAWSKVYIVCHGENCHLNYQSGNAVTIFQVTGMTTASASVPSTAKSESLLTTSSTTIPTTLILSAAAPNVTTVYHTRTEEDETASTITVPNVTQDKGSPNLLIVILPGCLLLFLLLTFVVRFLKQRRNKRSDEDKLINEEVYGYRWEVYAETMEAELNRTCVEFNDDPDIENRK